VHKLQTMVGDLHQRPIAIWGLSFKQDTDDIRESPAIDVVRMLIQRGAIPRCYDPAAMDNAREVVPEAEYFDDPYEAVRGTDALLVLTPWNEFKQADLGRVADLMRQPVLLDGRNLYDPADVRRLGFRYAGVGR